MISTRKYNVIVGIVILLILGALSFSGYFIYKNFINNGEKEEKNEGDIIEEVIVPDISEVNEDIISTKENENIVYDGYDISIRIPIINNELATDINKKIDNDILVYYENKDHSIDYDYYINNDVISLLIKVTSNDNHNYYFTYNFNKDDYSIIDNHSILKLKEIKEDLYHGILINIYDSHLEDSDETIDTKSSNYVKTTSKDNCNIDTNLMFLNNDNHVNVIFKEYQDNDTNEFIYNLNTKKVVE